MRNVNLETVFQQYAETALWSEMDDSDENTGGDPLDENYETTDIVTESVNEMKGDVADFVSAVQQERPDAFDGMEDAQIGHDFWLTRNHHGAGFWDRGLGELGDYLTKMAQAYGSQSLNVGDDGRLYIGG